MDGNPGLARILPSLTARELDRIERWSTLVLIRAGKALCYQGDESDAAWLVTAGRVRSLRIREGSSRSLGDAIPGSWLGLAELRSGSPRLADLLAVEESKLLRFGCRNFAELCREPWFKDLVIDELAREHCRLHGEFDAESATEKVARAIAALASRGAAAIVPAAGTVRLSITQTGLAEAAGLTRETVNRCLRKLEAAGLVETERSALLVYDVAGLREWID